MTERREQRRKQLPWLVVPLIGALLAGAALFLGPYAPGWKLPTWVGPITLGTGRGVPPQSLHIPQIQLNAKVIPISLADNGVLTPPADTKIVGWWDKSAGAGADRGQILLTGHTVHTGGGVMNKMGDVRNGALVVMKADGKKYRYRTTDNFVLTKEELAQQAKELFGQNRHHGRLVLVTCTDFRDGAYQSNIIVFAEPE